MSNNAIMIHSNIHGLFHPIKSYEIRSREHARKIGPFIDEEQKLVYWVKPAFDDITQKRKIKSYFRHYPKNNFKNRELNIPDFVKIHDPRHKIIQSLLNEILKEMIKNNHKLEWFFNDVDFSDFTLKGDLLREVKDVDVEYSVKIKPINREYRFDLVLLGKKIKNEPVILGAIELENTHEASFEKTLLCKSIGFPLLTIDIHDIHIENINKGYCRNLLIESTNTGNDSRRRNFYYIHNILQPIFLNIDDKYLKHKGHQYLIFFHSRTDREELLNLIHILRESLELTGNEIIPQAVNVNKNDAGSISMQENDVSLILSDFSEYDKNHYLRLIINRPADHSELYLFHLILSKLLTLFYDCLVGYKFQNKDCKNTDIQNRYWLVNDYNPETKERIYKKVCPKELSEPIYQIIRELKKIC